MEISQISEDSLKIKGKTAAFVVDPTKNLRVKTQADAVLLLVKANESDASKIEEYRVVISSPGEYEVSGAKLSGIKAGDHIVYYINIDGIQILLSSAVSLSHLKDTAKESEMLILHADTIAEESAITTLSPRIVVLYQEKAQDLAKMLGKDNVQKTQKYTIKKETLPEEMEVIILASS